uniref:Uncharacterized protein n=1 Tax=Arundo donax TaxID=35708 RepID=A0A0A9BF14_ARUDO
MLEHLYGMPVVARSSCSLTPWCLHAELFMFFSSTVQNS